MSSSADCEQSSPVSSVGISIPQCLNARAARLVDRLLVEPALYRVELYRIGSAGGLVIDFGVKSSGGLEAGRMLARICLADLAEVTLTTLPYGERAAPTVMVQTDHPVAACMFSQYAGWQLQQGQFFGMGSGPMRAVAGCEDLFQQLNYREQADTLVGVVESGKLPGGDVFEHIAERTGVATDRIQLCVARCSSLAGSFQVVARSVETALHKLHELGFDLTRVRSAVGTAPLPPVAADDLAAIGRTNDAVIYGGRVTLWVTGDDESLSDIGRRVPSAASNAYGDPFLKVFEQAGGDFYAIDPLLFSPAEITLLNIETGRCHTYGQIAPDILASSFGWL